MEESEERFREIVRQAPLGITILHGPDFIVEMANKAYLEIVDKTESEFVGKPLFDSLPDAKKEVEQLLSNVLLTGIPYYGYEFPVTLKRHYRKETAYFNFVYHPIKESNGSFSGIIAVATDVTPTVKAKHLIADSERQFRHMVIQSPIPMTILRGKEHLVETANKAMFEDIWRKTEEEVTGKPLLAIFPELKDQKYADLLNEVYTTGKTFNEKEAVAYLRTEKGTRTLYLDYEYAPLFETDNTISGIIVTISDVTGKVEARKIIEQSEQRNRSLIESAPFPIGVYIGREMRIQMLNQAIVKVWGKGTVKDIIGRTYAEVLPELKGQGIYEQLDSVYTTGIPFHAHNQRVDLMINNNLIPHYFNYSFTPLFDSEGKVYGVMNTAAEVTDLVLAKEKIEESEKRFRNVANSAPVFIWLAGTDGLRNFFNTAWLNFTGRTMEQETGEGWAAGVHPDDLEKCMDLYFTSFEKKEEYYMVYRLRRHDGEYRWISARGVPRFTSNNTFEGYIGACMDIHEQVIAQKKLKEDEERLNIIVAASDLGTWELNLKTMEVIYSDRYMEMFGYDKKVRLSHKELLTHLHPDDLPTRTAALKAAVSNGVLYYESRIIWKDKSVHWVENKGKVFYDEENNPQKIIGTTRDTTEEKNYAQQLLDREQKFRLLADSMPQFVWTGDAEGNLNYFSKAVEDYSGLTTAQLQKDGLLQIVHPDDREENIKAWKYAVASGTDFIFEHRFGRADGEYRWQLSRAIPQKDAAGNIQMWVGTSTDIQDMKEQEQLKDYFISMASHELKTPITSIKGYVQILQSTYQKSEDPFLKSSLKIIDKQIVTLTNLISDLLDLSKIKSGNLYLNKENFEITEMIQEVINEITHINPDYSIGFSLSIPATVHADRGRIAQVLINLLTNAVKYSPHSRKVMIENYVEGNLLTVVVEDSGIGISKNDQEKIFERFYRVEGKNEKTFPGFGIGLFISAEIINRHNGTIGVSSEPGKGSKFYFSIPLIT
jgi:PAS domain S-box-containing protein